MKNNEPQSFLSLGPDHILIISSEPTAQKDMGAIPASLAVPSVSQRSIPHMCIHAEKLRKGLG